MTSRLPPWLGIPVIVVVAACGSGSSGGRASPGDAGSDGTTAKEGGAGDSGGGTSDAGGVTEGGGGEGGADAPAGETGPAPIAGLRVFFTDLTSGPATGGQDGKGAFVTLYGNGFGASQGASTVTVGGGAVAGYPAWTNTKVTVQLGAAAQTGNVVVHVAGKGDSNGVPFTVRSGTIYFVSGTGKDANAGTFASPWGTIPKAKNSLAAGDIAYVGTSATDSVSQTTEDASSAYGGALGMSVNDGTNAGTATMPKALVVYPGATATIGDPVNLAHGIIVPSITGTFDYWTIAGFTLRGLNEAIELEGSSQGWRIVGNDISCPNGSGESGCVTDGAVNSAPGLAFLGNDVHDAAASVTSVTKY
ncbi:MAG TPA: IPT/TIG domain-containing protein, partial [Polyangiaceae bacterium]